MDTVKAGSLIAVPMNRVLALCLSCLLSACASSEWQNSKRADANYAADHEMCEHVVMRNPYIRTEKVRLEIRRCMNKEGWVQPYRSHSAQWFPPSLSEEPTLLATSE